MFEHRREALLPRPLFIWRIFKFGALSFGLAAVSLLIGIFGYRNFEGMSWIDAFVNAAMILGGMGPVNPLKSPSGKLFAGLSALGLGLLVSTAAESQLLAFQVVLILAFLPTFLLSGFIFPIQNMPKPIQLVTYVVPARYFLVALRGIVLKGVGLATVWPSLAALGIFSVVVLGLASVRLARERG